MINSDPPMFSRRTVLKSLGLAGGLISLPGLTGLLRLASTAEPMRVGLFAPLSGRYADVGGIGFFQGVSLAARELERRGGRGVELIVQDTASNTSTAHNRARALLQQGRIHCLIAAATTAEALSLDGAFWGENISYLVMGSHSIGQHGQEHQQHVFTSAFREPLLIGGFASWLEEHLNKTTPWTVINHCNQRSRSILAKEWEHQWMQKQGWSEVSPPRSYVVKIPQHDPDLFTLRFWRGDVRSLVGGITNSTGYASRWRRLSEGQWRAPRHFARWVEHPFEQGPAWATMLGYLGLMRLSQLINELDLTYHEMGMRALTRWQANAAQRIKGMTELFVNQGDDGFKQSPEPSSVTFRSFLAVC